MKKLFAAVIGFGLCMGLNAQGLGARMADLEFDREIGDSPFSYELISYLYFGFNGIVNADAQMAPHSNFFYSQEFGFNMAEFAFKPYENGRISLGADVHWNWYRLSNGFYWWPYNVNTPQFAVENALLVRPVAIDDIYSRYYVSEVKKSTLSVCTFSFPLDFAQQFGKITLHVGASFEINLNACSQFRGTAADGSALKEMVPTGAKESRYSRNIRTNRFTYNIHGSVSYGGLGIYGRYNPMPQLGEGFGPQFSTWTVGLILGLGM